MVEESGEVTNCKDKLSVRKKTLTATQDGKRGRVCSLPCWRGAIFQSVLACVVYFVIPISGELTQ